MPLAGTRLVEPLLERAPLVDMLNLEPVVLHGVEVMQVLYEIDSAAMLELLPPALNPTIPPTLTFLVMSCPAGDLGAFTLAEVRVGCRAGVRPRGFPLMSFCSGDPGAIDALRRRWGYQAAEGDVRLRRYHDRAIATVERGGRTLLNVQVVDPQPISGADIQYVANMNLALVQRDGETKPRLIQVDPEFTFHRASRGRPHVERFDRAAWYAEDAAPVYPVSATVATADVTMPRVRYLCDPDVPALQGTETVR